MTESLVLSAPQGTTQELVLIELATGKWKDTPLRREFSKWRKTPFGMEASGTIMSGNRSVSVCLQIGGDEGTLLKDMEGDGHTFSRKGEALLIAIGKELSETEVPHVAESIAEMLVTRCGTYKTARSI